MSPLQTGSLAFAFLGPLVLWALHRRRPQPRLERDFARGLAALLLVVLAAELAEAFCAGTLATGAALPMQLCDWALGAVVGALLWRSQTCFELGYFWGLCGTSQALITPALASSAAWWRQLEFYLAHAGIVAGVLFLLLVPRMRPHGMGRVLVWSAVYLTAALAVNALTGANYGFLAHRPVQRTLLDFFPDAHWPYVAAITATATVCFAAFYLPWLIAGRVSKIAAPIPRA